MPVSSISSSKTLFVVGAGASTEVEGLPIGSGLASSIAEALNFKIVRSGVTGGDNEIYDAILGLGAHGQTQKDSGKYLKAAKHIRDAMSQAISIDNYIDQQKGNKEIELCAKLAIVRTILKAESQSKLYRNLQRAGNLDFNHAVIRESWFASLWKRITENCTAKDLEYRFRNVAFIIFNYDRCIEQYVYHSIQNSYPTVSAEEAAKLVKCIDIFHPYGTVGSLPWQQLENAIEYGGEPNVNQLRKLADQIKTFTEGIHSDELISIRSLMMTSHRIVFLGFAFHKINLDLLLSNHAGKPSAQYICGTTYKMSQDSTTCISNELMEVYKQLTPVLRNDLMCNQLFHEFERRLSFV
jgi:hypothetical protein